MASQSAYLKMTVLALSVVAASIASAQYNTPANYGLKFSLFYPTDSSIRDSVGKTGFNIGFAYFLKYQADQQSSIDLDYFRLGGSDYYQAISLGYTARYFQTKNMMEAAPYFGFSVGITFSRLSATTSMSGSGGGSGGSSSITESKTQPYAELIGGYRMDKQTSLELYYRIAADIGGFHTNALGLRLNYKF